MESKQLFSLLVAIAKVILHWRARQARIGVFIRMNKFDSNNNLSENERCNHLIVFNVKFRNIKRVCLSKKICLIQFDFGIRKPMAN